MRWLDDMKARELLSDGWRRYACVINTRRGEIQRNLDSFIGAAFQAMDGHEDAVDLMRARYRSMQTYARMLGDLMAAVREVHRERGTALTAGELRRTPLPPAPTDEEIAGISVPLMQWQWLNEQPIRAVPRGC